MAAGGKNKNFRVRGKNEKGKRKTEENYIKINGKKALTKTKYQKN